MDLRPPPPRQRPDVDVACAVLEGASPPIAWGVVFSPLVMGAWVGVRPDADFCNLGDCRLGRWLWDVVESQDARDDPLVLVVPQDLVHVSISDGEHCFDLTVDVSRCPEEIEIPASALPPPPWRLDWATGWSTAALHHAVQSWMAEQGVGAALSAPPARRSSCYDLGSAAVSDRAFDDLLSLEHHDAVAVTRVFDAVMQDLDRRGCVA